MKISNPAGLMPGLLLWHTYRLKAPTSSNKSESHSDLTPWQKQRQQPQSWVTFLLLAISAHEWQTHLKAW